MVVRSFEDVRKTMIEYDRAHPRECPVDQRRAEREAEEQARNAHAEQGQNTRAYWLAVIDQRIQQQIARWWGTDNGECQRGVMIDAIGEVIGMERQDRRDEVKHIEEERHAVDAKHETLEEASNERWATIDQHIERARETVAQRNSEALGQERMYRRKEVKTAIEEAQRAVDAKFTELEQRLKSSPAKLPVAKSWQPESITYEAEMVAHNGALWQARKDTAQKPGGSDWVLIARHGRDALTPTLRGTYDTHECYSQLDVIEFDGAAYIAQRDNPGISGHGDGWQVLSKRGKQGRRGKSVRGPQGAKGDKGDDALEIVNWHIDAVGYRAVPFISNGKPGPALELRDLFLRFIEEVGQ